MQMHLMHSEKPSVRPWIIQIMLAWLHLPANIQTIIRMRLQTCNEIPIYSS